MIWEGAEELREHLVPIEQVLDDPEAAVGAQDEMVAALRSKGQQRPVLVGSDGVTVTYRQHLLNAARILEWSHIAIRLEVAEEAGDPTDQMTFVDVLEQEAGSKAEAADMIQAMGKAEQEVDIDEVNQQSADPDHEWVGLPEFVGGEEPFKVIISCETEEDRDALFDVLGIKTVHKGTRGTLSVWWPDRARKDLASLRFRSDSNAA